MSDVVNLVTLEEKRDEGIQEVADEAFDFINDRLNERWEENRLSNFYIHAVVVTMMRSTVGVVFDEVAAADFEIFLQRMKKEAGERLAAASAKPS